MARTGYGRSFWLLWASATVSGLGDGLRFIALPLLATSVTRDPGLVALVTVAGQLPWLVVGPVTGVATDRLDRRVLAWRVAVIQTIAMGLFASMVGLGKASIILIASVAFVLGSADTLSMNVAAAMVPDLTGRERLTSANSLLQGGQFLTSDFVGVSIGAVLFGLAPVLPFAIDATSFALAAALLLMIRPFGGALVERKMTLVSIGHDIAEGMRWLLRHRLLRALCVLVALSNFAVVGVMAIAVLYALDELGVSRTTYGFLMAIVAIGGSVGFGAGPWLAKRLGSGPTLQLTFLLSPVSFLVTGLTSQPLVAAIAFFFVGASISIGNVVSISLRQNLVPANMFGRVNSSFRLVALGFGPLGGGVAGMLSEVFGLRAPFLFGAGLLIVPALLAVPVLHGRVVARAEAESRVDHSGAEPGAAEPLNRGEQQRRDHDQPPRSCRQAG